MSQQVQTLLDECAPVVHRYIDQLSGIVQECLQSCGRTWATCESCVVGKINDRFATAGIVSRKCIGKLVDQAQMLFGQAVALTEPIIGQIPDLQTVVAAQLLDVPIVQAANAMMPPASAAIVPTEEPKVLPPLPGGGQCAMTLLGNVGHITADGGLSCPPGYIPSVTADGCYGQCVPIPGYQPPPTPPVAQQCEVIPPTCPAGQHLELDVERNHWICVDDVPPCDPPTVVCPEGQSWQWDGKAWSCKPTAATASFCAPLPPQTAPPPTAPPATLADAFGFTDWNKLVCPAAYHPIEGQDVAGIQAAWTSFVQAGCNGIWEGVWNYAGRPKTDFFLQILRNALKIVCDLEISVGKKIIHWLGLPRDCDYLAIMGPVGVRAFLSFVEHWLDVGLDDIITNLNYTIQRACPTLLPGQAGVDQAYMGNQIDFETWTCWTRANNNLDKPAFAAFWSSRNQPNVAQWISAFQRELIDEDYLNKKLRGSGVLDIREETIFKQLMEQLPGPGDIVRFMLRDVEDPAVVAKFGLDAEFNEKFQGKTKLWAKGQGVSEDLMSRYWRAHWDWPSATQLFEMLHRLRADSLDPNNQKLAVTLQDVVQVLGVNDVIPIWREKLAAISYRLPRLLDAFKLFDRDIWGEPQLVDYYQSYGYPKPLALEKVKLDKQKKEDARNAKSQLVTKANTSKAYIDGAIGEAEALTGFALAGLDDDQARRALQQAMFLKQISLRRKILKAVKCRFATCELTKDAAVRELTVAGWNLTDAVAEVTCWKSQCDAKGKEATTAMLCDWYGLGLLSEFEYKRRLMRLGWSADDADRIMVKCSVDQIKKASKAKVGSSNGNGKQ